MPRTVTHSYFVVMRDFGGRIGLGADVTPELTRRNIIDRIKSEELDRIVFIHHVADGVAEDVTAELIDEAEAELKAVLQDEILAAVEAFDSEDGLLHPHPQFAAWDHERDLRKHSEVV
jgi:hypothetical protein